MAADSVVTKVEVCGSGDDSGEGMAELCSE